MERKKLNQIQNYIGCLFQALVKPEKSELKKKIKYALGEYAYNVILSTHLDENKRIFLLNELIHALDKDTLSEEQFKDEVFKIRSSDETRHFLKNALKELKLKNSDDEESEDEKNLPGTSNDTFEDKYNDVDDFPRKRKFEELKMFDSRKRKNNINNILKKITNFAMESDNDLNIEKQGDNVIYFHRDYPFEERNLIQDIMSIFQNDQEILEEIPISTKLTILDILNDALKSSDIAKLPVDYKRNVGNLCKPYSKFEYCKFLS